MPPPELLLATLDADDEPPDVAVLDELDDVALVVLSPPVPEGVPVDKEPPDPACADPVVPDPIALDAPP